MQERFGKSKEPDKIAFPEESVGVEIGARKGHGIGSQRAWLNYLGDISFTT